MSENMWNLNLSDLPAIKPPESIVEQQCDYLREATFGRVVARVSSYSGPTANYTYTKPGIHNIIQKALRNDSILLRSPILPADSEEVSVDIQEDLGDVGSFHSMYFSYEFFLTSPSTPNYKFRIMFFTYTAGQYPVGIVLDSDIAVEIGEKQNISCSSEDKFKDAVKRIITSSKVIKVIETLNAVALNEENRKNALAESTEG